MKALMRFPLLCAILLAASCGDDDPAGGDPDAAVVPGADAPPGTPDAAPSADADPFAPDGGALTDPSEPGGWGLSRTDGVVPRPGGGNISITVWAPSDDGGATIATRGAPFPLITISPGFQMPRTQYESYGVQLATWGYVAIGVEFPPGFSPAPHENLAANVRTVVDWALGAESGLASSIDATKIGAAGHSLGGKVSLLAASADPRFKAVVGWDPVDANSPSVAPERMGTIAGPVAVLGETTNSTGGFQPCAPAAENYQQYFAAATPPALEITLIEANHMDWVDDTSCGFCGLCSPAGTLGDDVVKRVTRRATVAWFERHLRGDTRMDEYLTGAAVQPDVSAGILTIQSK